MTNSIPLSGGAADVSGFVRSGFARRRSIRQGETDDVVKVHQSSSSPALRSGYDVSPVFRHLSLSPSSFLVRSLSTLSSPGHRLVLREKLLRGASLFWLPYFTDSEPSALPPFRHSIPFRPFHPTYPLRHLVSLLSLHFAPFVLAPTCYA